MTPCHRVTSYQQWFIFEGVEVIVSYYIPTPGCFDLKVIEGNFIAVMMRQKKVLIGRVHNGFLQSTDGEFYGMVMG
jgi:hypothetical protein